MSNPQNVAKLVFLVCSLFTGAANADGDRQSERSFVQSIQTLAQAGTDQPQIVAKTLRISLPSPKVNHDQGRAHVFIGAKNPSAKIKDFFYDGVDIDLPGRRINIQFDLASAELCVHKETLTSFFHELRPVLVPDASGITLEEIVHGARRVSVDFHFREKSACVNMIALSEESEASK